MAFEDYIVGKTGAIFRVVVVDLRSGRRIHDAQTGTPPSNAEGVQGGGAAEGIGPTTKIVVRKTGSAAWIARDSYSDTPVYEVHEVDAIGGHLLDRAATVQPDSLRLAGSLVTWIDAGTRRSATLR